MATKTSSVDPSKHADEAFDLYSIPAFDQGAPAVALGSAIGSAKQAVEPQDVLLSKIVPHIRRTWVVGESRGRRLIGSGEWMVFRSSRANSGYLRQVLRSDPFHAQFMQTVAGVGGSLLRARPAQVAKISIRLPPLPEQRRIAAILDQADALRAKRREALTQLDGLAQSIFNDMFCGALASAKRIAMSDLVEEFRYGTSEKSGNEGFPALRIPNVANGRLDLRELKTVSVDAAEFKRLQLKAGDLLFVRTNGNPDNVGRCAVFDPSLVTDSGFNPTEFIYASYLIRARLRQASVSSVVLQQYLHAGGGRQALRAVCKTSAGQYNINTEGLGAIPIPSFPTERQQAFAIRVRAIESLRITHRAALTELDTLFASLQHRAFTGQLS